MGRDDSAGLKQMGSEWEDVAVSGSVWGKEMTVGALHLLCSSRLQEMGRALS